MRSTVSRRHLVAAIALITIATGPLGLLAWQASVRQHRLSTALLKAEAMVMAQRYANRVIVQLYMGATAVVRPLNGGRFRQIVRVPPDARLMYAGADSAANCRCAPVFRPSYVFRIDPTDDVARVDGRAPDLNWLTRSARARAIEVRGGWDVAMLGKVDPEGRIVFIAPVATSEDKPPTIYGFGVDTSVVNRAAFKSMLSQTERLAIAQELRNDSAFAIAVRDEADVALFQTTHAVDSAIASRFTLGDVWGGFSVNVSLQPVASARVLAGAVPASPLPFLVALLVIAALLIGAALVLLWRAFDLARLRGDFTSSVSHELRTPLTQILLYAETLEMGRDESPEERRRRSAS